MMVASLEYIRTRRNLPFVKRGMRVCVDGQWGRITGGNGSGNLNVRFGGENFSQNVHPWWHIQYFDKNGNLIKEFGD